MSGNNVAVTVPQISQNEYREIETFADAIELAQTTYGGVATAAELLSDGFASIDKSELINKPFLVIAYKLSDSREQFDEDGVAKQFVIVRIVLENGDKHFFTDGSTGIMAQCQTLESRGIYGGIMAKRGLRVSEYEYIDDKGKKSIAKTYYVNTDANAK